MHMGEKANNAKAIITKLIFLFFPTVPLSQPFFTDKK